MFVGGYSAGANFHSASWGNTDPSYGGFAQLFDYVAGEIDEFLPLVAAGNYGLGNAMSSVGNPGVAKNVITVGATQSSGRDIYSGMKGPEYCEFLLYICLRIQSFVFTQTLIYHFYSGFILESWANL